MTIKLYQYILDNGFRFKYGHALRCQDCPTGHINSLHKWSLAIDILLFTANGVYLTKTVDYLWLGKYWESLGGSWGGRFGESSTDAGDGEDGNHFSLEYNNMR